MCYCVCLNGWLDVDELWEYIGGMVILGMYKLVGDDVVCVVIGWVFVVWIDILN